MKYYFYLDNILMPVTPSELRVTQDGKNEVFDLAAGGEVTIPKTPGLRQYAFSLLLPVTQYPFASYIKGFRPPEFYLRRLLSLREKAKPFDMVIVRRLNADLVMKFASNTLGYGSEEAYYLTGSGAGTVQAADARTILREGVSGKAAYLFDTTETVVIEEMTIAEDAERFGEDILVELRLRQYAGYQPVERKGGGSYGN